MTDQTYVRRPLLLPENPLGPTAPASFSFLLCLGYQAYTYLKIPHMLFSIPAMLTWFPLGSSSTPFSLSLSDPFFSEAFPNIALETRTIFIRLSCFSFFQAHSVNIWLCHCLSHLPVNRTLAPWELGLCLVPCCFSSNQIDAGLIVNPLNELILEYEVEG